ncbi:MAG: hypothetical protein QG568_147 [Patescibacteria group bacterium]|nr:hypothetical protein [Patescibacteria group bacterium]
MKIINNPKNQKNIINKAILTAFLAFAVLLTPAYFASASTDGYWGDFSSGYSGDYDYGNSGYSGDYDYGYSGYSGDYDYGYNDYGYNSTPSYYGGYSTPSYGGGGYSYTPSPVYDYVYNTPSRGGTSGGSSAPQMQYVYSSNTNNNANANANENNNNVSNTFNPTNINNNDARINLIVYGGGTGTNTPAPTPALNGNCVISPTVGYINQDISFSASASGGNGSYSYSWTGDNGINSNAQNFTGRYSYSGYKTATVTIRSGSDSITRTCGVNIQDTAVVSGAYCVANPTNAGINQNVTWTAYVNNTNGYYGSYSYSWTGSDNLYGNGQSISRSYNTPGYKTATVTMYGNGQSITATCNTNINGVLANQSNVTVIRDQNLGTPVSGVFLSQVPATGVGFGLKMTLFSVGLVLWSIFAAYMISRKKNGAFANKINAFKLANMQKKGIIG